jgi:hypothetical protein
MTSLPADSYFIAAVTAIRGNMNNKRAHFRKLNGRGVLSENLTSISFAVSRTEATFQRRLRIPESPTTGSKNQQHFLLGRRSLHVPNAHINCQTTPSFEINVTA